MMKKAYLILHRFRFLIPLLMIVGATGCASTPYQYGASYQTDLEYQMPEDQEQIERGRPNAFLDASDWIWPESLLGKLLLFNWKVDRHHISPETEQAIVTYLDKNNMPNVKVRLNQYRPGGEWSRLFKNRAVGAGWRYTFGVLATAGYTILPGRFFGGDNYNPYTNTMNIYSDVPAIGLHEAGHAKDTANRKWKGSYAALYAIPGVPLYHEAQATGDAIGYLQAEGDKAGEKAAYKILYPAYGTYVGGTFSQFIEAPWNYVIQLGGIIPGHIVGRTKALMVEE
jgi:hypothetical protein